MSLHTKRLENDTVVNVAQLLKEPVGAVRTLETRLDRLPLDNDLRARDVEADVRLTRIATGILAEGRVRGVAQVECVRCLEVFDAAFDGEFDAEYRASVDVRTGEPLPLPHDDEVFVIDHNHELDVSEILRQVAIISLPMRPVCDEVCQGIVPESDDEGEADDERFAVLRDLLDEESE